MSITIRLSADEEKRLADWATQSERDLVPFRLQVETSGLFDDDLSDFFDEVREEVWREKQEQSSQSF